MVCSSCLLSRLGGTTKRLVISFHHRHSLIHHPTEFIRVSGFKG
jgi:hypothetical protein